MIILTQVENISYAKLMDCVKTCNQVVLNVPQVHTTLLFNNLTVDKRICAGDQQSSQTVFHQFSHDCCDSSTQVSKTAIM